jgi:hypothetical protein
VRYTFAGDANLDGIIGGDDYFHIDAGYLAHADAFVKGDFNYDARIDADDYFLIDANYAHARAPLAPAVFLSNAELPQPAFEAFEPSVYERLRASQSSDSDLQLA